MQKFTYKILFFIAIFVTITIAFYFLSFLEENKKNPKKTELHIQELKKELTEEETRANEELKNYLLGKFDPKNRDDFVLVPEDHTLYKAKIYLRKEVSAAFLAMVNKAKSENINLKVTSGTRNFDYQKNIWENKWTGKKLVDGKNLMESFRDESMRFDKILEYSAAPSTSRHHWGTDIDINDADPAYFETEQGKKEYEWLVSNAPSFGFCQVYDKKGLSRFAGYNEEKWHWSYLPLAFSMTIDYENIIKLSDIQGFLGDQYVKEKDIIKNYVLSLNPDCFSQQMILR